MPIVLFRVDERLIHGQVVVGWGGHLNADKIIVVDDEIAASPWEQELYCLGVPPEIEASFTTVDSARSSWISWKESDSRIIVLVRDVATVRRLTVDSMMHNEEVNLGGIHHAAGRERVLPYLFLNQHEQEQLREIADTGASISARDLPASRRVPLNELLAAK